ncbi:MAG: hypothetical protein ABFS23_01405 [Pseudomonadota bacterium]
MVRQPWIRTIWTAGRPVLFLSAVCYFLGTLFIVTSAVPVGVVMVAAGTVALVTMLAMALGAG